MFPHTLTLYTVESRTDSATMRTEQVSNITVLEGVLMVPVMASKADGKGYAGADTVTVYIPFGVRARDGVSGSEKRYVKPKAYAQAEDKADIWTLSTAGKTFYIKGEVVEPEKTRAELEQAFDDVYSLTRVARRDFGPEDMRHWEIGGA